jgi:hypothetical protein
MSSDFSTLDACFEAKIFRITFGSSMIQPLSYPSNGFVTMKMGFICGMRYKIVGVKARCCQEATECACRCRHRGEGYIGRAVPHRPQPICSPHIALLKFDGDAWCLTYGHAVGQMSDSRPMNQIGRLIASVQ